MDNQTNNKDNINENHFIDLQLTGIQITLEQLIQSFKDFKHETKERIQELEEVLDKVYQEGNI